MKKSKKMKQRVKDLTEELAIQESIIESLEREIAELWAKIRQIKGDAFDMINSQTKISE